MLIINVLYKTFNFHKKENVEVQGIILIDNGYFVH